MRKITLLLASALFYMCSCSENKANENPVITEQSSKSPKDTPTPEAKNDINFSNLEQYFSADSLYSFVAPEGFFYSSPMGLRAVDIDFEIETINFAQNYPCDPDEEILSLKSVQAKFIQNVKVTYKPLKADFFVVSGIDKQSRVVYAKGLYAELKSMQGQEDGEPTLMWRKVGVISFRYPQEKKTDFNRVVEIIANSLQVNHDLM